MLEWDPRATNSDSYRESLAKMFLGLPKRVRHVKEAEEMTSDIFDT